MDVTFTNVLEGARQYFQGLPMGSNSAASPMYPNGPDNQQRNSNESVRSQDGPPTSSPYWTGQPESHRIPSRESTGSSSQRPASYNSDSSRPPSSHSSYVNTNHEQRRTPNYPAGYPEQPSHFQQHQQQQQQQPPPPQPQHGQQQQPLQQSTQDFQFTRPHYRETPIVSHQYSPHIQQNSAYHHSSSSHNPAPTQNMSPTSKQRKMEQNITPPHHNQVTIPPSSYPNYQQNRTYYPATSYPNLQGVPDNKDYSQSRSYPYQQSSQVNNTNYYKNIYQPHSSSSSVQYSASTVTHSSNPEQNSSYIETSRTHNLPPIAQLSESYLKSVRDNQKLNTSRVQNSSNFVSNSSAMKSSSNNQNVAAPNNSHPQQNYQMEYSYSNRSNQVPSTSTITTTSSTYNTTAVSRTNSYSVQTLTPSNAYQFTPPKPTLSTVNSQLGSSSNSNTPNTENKRQQMNYKQKKESPLDLSVKTVRTPADSTLDDAENEKSHCFSNRVPAITANNLAYENYSSSYQRNIQRVPPIPSASAPKVDFLPNFNVNAMRNMQQTFRPDNRPPLQPQLQHPTSRNLKHSPENTNNSTFPREKENPSMNRYPTVAVPSISNVNSYMQTQSNNKNASKVLPRIDFPTLGHGLKTAASYPSSHSMDSQRKRPADIAPSLTPSLTPKMMKVEAWRQTIDKQIEQKLSTYKPVQLSPKQQMTGRPPLHNGNYNPNVSERSKDIYNNYTRPPYQMGIPPQQSYNQYYPHASHSQTYVPSPASNPYGGNTSYSPHQQKPFAQNELTRSNSNSSLSSTKSGSGGAADKRVLTLLRNSIETKGVKEAQRKYEQVQYNKYGEQPHHRPDIPHPSTHVTAPLQPKPAFMGRQNVSPFTPNSLPEGNNVTPMYNKLHLPRAVDSINFELNKTNGNMTNKQLTETVISDQSNSNSDYDGLAAFLAARIRTKAELKQVSPTQQANNNSNNVLNNIENPVRIPNKLENANFSSSGSSLKMMKENYQTQQPRKRLFSRTEDEFGSSSTKSLPPRDKSGMRSSSETSVFDFPDSGSDGEMSVSEMQSLNAMRRDRKSSVKQTSNETESREYRLESLSPRPAIPEDDIFSKACDNFMDQLKTGVGKKRGRRKKALEPEVLAKLETVRKEKPIVEEIIVKQEIIDENPDRIKEIDTNNDLSNEKSSIQPFVSTPIANVELLCPRIVKIELPDSIEEQVKINKQDKLKEQVDSSDSDSETIKQLSNKLKSKAINKLPEETEVTIGPTETLSVSNKPPKKPTFGDGSAFYPGWEEEVYKYKKSLRMPPSLIQVTRPPSALRLSTSLPDLDPCPSSPSSSIVPEKDEDSKCVFAKVKSEPVDSDVESNSSFNLFHNKSNYDSEGSASIKSLPAPVKDSIVDKLLQKCGKRKKRKYKKREDQSPKIIPKAENPIELLPTPSLEIKSDKKITKETIIKVESPILGFRKSTMNNFKDAFLSRANSIVGVNEQFSTVILKSRTRKETRVLKQRATIKEVFGEDRPASAPPVTCINLDIKEVKTEVDEPDAEKDENEIESCKIILKDKLYGRGRPKSNLLKSIADKKLRTETFDDTIMSFKEIKSERDQSPSAFSEDFDSKSETPSLDGDDSNASTKRRVKYNKIRRKFSSGFDYIRKKKKQVKKENDQKEIVPKRKKRDLSLKASPESEQDIQKEIKSWVLNKGIGETHLHRSARLGYTDITAFCLEKLECSPSAKDNAGYTPLHEACSRGHLEIARLLLMYGANVSESAKGGIRPLHEAAENGFVEIIRLLLSYGADPKLATYSGLTPLALTSDEDAKELLETHMNDLEGKSNIPWAFPGPASCFDPTENGYDALRSPPQPDSPFEEDDMEFEVSEYLLPNLYTLQGEAQSDRWILLQDLSNILKIKSRDALLKQLFPSPSSGGTQVNYKNYMRELKVSDFMEQAQCCQFLNASEKINLRASKIVLVKYTDKMKELLKVETVVIPAR